MPISVSSHIIVSLFKRDNYIGEISALEEISHSKKNGTMYPRRYEKYLSKWTEIDRENSLRSSPR